MIDMTDNDFPRFRAQHPDWSVWWAAVDNTWHAAPLWDGAPLELAQAPTLTELAEHMRFLERRRVR